MIAADMNVFAELLVAKQKLDTQSALLAQMAGALKTIRFCWSGHAEECAYAKSKYRLKCDCDWPKVSEECDAALTAYAASSPDPQWQRVPEGCEVVNLPSVNTIVDLIKQNVRVSVSNYGLSAEMEDMDDAAIAILNRARGEG